eukprot:TRINITY_DN7186_c0_g2_i1.p1 TRINITY_DN7186_c0_g2~~TRINITY_DN7186_c0_g2_i1.p1  ORF type:complete len:523 (-),score=55.79 TRINITY_DN7186_c0_g2_i1:26-1414(-)
MSETHEFFTLGSLDLGGSSLEVTFVPTHPPREGYGANVSVQSSQYHLYAHSHAGYGLNDGFDKSVTVLLEKQGKLDSLGGMPVVKHPCLHGGYNRTYARSKVLMKQTRRRLIEKESRVGKTAEAEALAGQVDVLLEGAPDWDKCKALASDVVAGAGNCKNPPCALGAHQPPLRGHFYALTGFYVVYHFLRLPTDAPLDRVLEGGQAFCARSWDDVDKSLRAVRNLDRYCFRAPYIVSLLREGLGLLDKQVTVGSGDMGWTLGAALYEAGALRSRHHLSSLVLGRADSISESESGTISQASWPGIDRFPGSADDLMPYLVLVLILVVIVVTTGVRWQQVHNRRRGYGSGLSLYGAAPGLSWLRLPVQTAATNGVRNVGDWEGGRVKLSPQPERRLCMKNGVLGRDLLESLKGAPDTSPGNSGYPLGKPTNLSSRRTQSREDLMGASRDFGRDRDRERDADSSH